MSLRWMRRVLGLAPRTFRTRYVDELLATYADRERVAAAEGRLTAFRLRELVGAAVLVARLHVGLERSASAADTPRRPTPRAIGEVWHDVRSSLRSLRRSPGYSLAAIAVLALGMGATSAIFSAVNASFFRPLPFGEPDRLVTVFETNPEFGWVDETAAPANLLDWRAQVGAFADVSGYSEGTDELTTLRDGEPVIITGTEVLGNFFSTLDVPPALGRVFRFEQTWAGDDDVVVLGHDLWVSHFGADPDIVGKTVELSDRVREIVGVTPAGFRFPDDDVQLWYPMGFDPAAVDQAFFRRAHFVRAFARLAPDVTMEEADAELQGVVLRLQRDYPATNTMMGAGIVPLHDFLVRDIRKPLGVLFGAAGFLLLLACANVANLQLVRASERTGELAVRRALGAGRGRLARQVLVEGSVLAAVGGVLGLAIGWAGVRALASLVPVGINGATSLSLDHRVVLFTFAAAGLSMVAFGAVPALRAMWVDTRRVMPERGRGSSADRAQLRVAGSLVSVQVALALLLVTGAGLMLRSFWLLTHVDPGFRTDGVVAAQFTVPAARYPNRDQVLDFYDRFAAALEARPGIGRVGTVGRLPLDGGNWSSQFRAEGWPPERVGFEILHRRADPGYFEALGIPLLRGRMLEPTDRAGAPLVVVVNEAFAREHFPGEDPVGQRIAFTRVAGPGDPWLEIVGLVGDQPQESLARPARPEVFESRSQDWGRANWVVVRAEGDVAQVTAAIREVLEEMDPLIPLARVRPGEELRSQSMASERLVLVLLVTFGISALILAAVGVYAVTSRAARRRTQEIGIRMAFGAGASHVVRLVLGQGLKMIGVGLAAGLLASLLGARLLSSLLYGIEPTDPATLASVLALLGGVALAACYVPARRATAVDPLTSLRSE